MSKENSTLTNGNRVNNLSVRVRNILESMPLETIQSCSRRAREYKLSYQLLINDDNKELKIVDVEKIKKISKVSVVHLIKIMVLQRRCMT